MKKILLLSTGLLLSACQPIEVAVEKAYSEEPRRKVYHFTTNEGLECVTISDLNNSFNSARAGISCNWASYTWKKNNGKLNENKG